MSSAFIEMGLFLFARLSALLSVAPLIGARSVPVPVRVGLAAVLALVLVPVVPHGAVAGLGAFVVGLVKEVVVGLMLGWVASLVFAAVQMAGEWLDLHGGFQVAQVFDPTFDTQNGLLGQFQYLLAALVFLGSGGYGLVIRAAVESTAWSPPGVLQLHVETEAEWVAMVTRAVWLAVQIAAPVAAALFLAEVAVALLGRAMPQMNLLILALPVKGWLAIAALALALPIVAQVLASSFRQMFAGWPR